MKIAVIHSIYQPYVRGGAEVVVENIVSGLRARGEDVFVVTIGKKNQIAEVDGVKIYRIKPFNLFNFLDIGKKPAWLRLPWHIIDMFNDVQTWRVYKILTTEKPDLVLTHNLKGLGYYLPWLIRLMKLKSIHTIHDAQLVHPSGLYDAKSGLNLSARLYMWLCKKLFGSPEAVIFPSQYIQNVYDDFGFFYRSKKYILGNPILLNHKGGDGQADKNIKSSYQQGEKLKLLFVGQVEEYKGILDLIEAVKRVNGNLSLAVVGDGSALVKAQELAISDRRIKFYGRLNFGDAIKQIKPHIFVNPSKTPESFGLVVAEAFSYGLPVISSNIGALPELVEEGVTGYLVQPDSVTYLQDKINWCLNNQEKISALSDNCLQRSSKFAIDAYLNKLLEYGNINK